MKHTQLQQQRFGNNKPNNTVRNSRLAIQLIYAEHNVLSVEHIA